MSFHRKKKQELLYWTVNTIRISCVIGIPGIELTCGVQVEMKRSKKLIE